jgi:oxazoline/thiazoline dehydrogenase
MIDAPRDGVPLPFTLSLTPAAILDESDRDSMAVTVGRRRLLLGVKTSGLLAAVQRLAGPGATTEELHHLVVDREGPGALPALYLCLLELSAANLLGHGVHHAGRPLITAIPVGAQYKAGHDRLDPSTRYVLSRFAFLRRDGDRTVLESPRSFARILVHDWRGAALIGAFATPSRCADLDAGTLGMPAEALAACAELLWTLAFLLPVDVAAASEEEADGALAGWEFHDLLFHSRSRRGRHRNPFGATYPLQDRSAPLPAVKPHMTDRVIPLFKPDLDAIRAADQPFTTVLENRRSRRQHHSLPLTDRQLGEFLYRSCRIRRVIPAGAHERYEATERVFPSGGATYPLEIYVVVGHCAGIAPGLYHYRGTDHDLAHLSNPTEHTASLLRSAGYAAATAPPQVLIVLAARIQRVAWKYSSMAYAIILKDVGVLYQTMYLVATAMGLAGCALGSGNSDLFSRASGLDYYAESSVGEFIVGRADAAQ